MQARVQSVWNHCLERISDVVPKYSYNTWILPLRAVSLEEQDKQVLNLEVPNVFHQKWVEENYIDIVRQCVCTVLGPTAALHLLLPATDASDTGERYNVEPAALPAPSSQPTGSQSNASQPNPSQPNPSQPNPSQPNPSQPNVSQPNAAFRQAARPLPVPSQPGVPLAPRQPHNLNESYNFDELVEGDGNRLARSAALAIAHQPGGTSFNPLFVYGDVGLGKTHLAQAICLLALQQNTARNPRYLSIDEFTNQFIASIRANRAHEFTTYFRQVDLLIVDDIQFLTGKERTQEEFFHLFNAIHQSGGQIVLCADRAPGDIQGIHNRLVSRFHWGLTTDIKPPDFETRLAILQHKAQRYRLSLDNEVAEAIAHAVASNVRELESVLTKILAYSSLHRTPVTLHLAERVLQQYGRPSRTITLDEIIAIVSETFGIPPEYIVGKTRKREIVVARHTAMYLAKEFTHRSLKSIGRHFAGRDHSTVIHAVKAVDARFDTDPSFRKLLEQARQIVQKRVVGARATV